MSTLSRIAGSAGFGLPVLGAVGTALAQDKITVSAIIYARDSQFWQQIEKCMHDAAKVTNGGLLVSMS